MSSGDTGVRSNEWCRRFRPVRIILLSSIIDKYLHGESYIDVSNRDSWSKRRSCDECGESHFSSVGMIRSKPHFDMCDMILEQNLDLE